MVNDASRSWRQPPGAITPIPTPNHSLARASAAWATIRNELLEYRNGPSDQAVCSFVGETILGHASLRDEVDTIVQEIRLQSDRRRSREDQPPQRAGSVLGRIAGLSAATSAALGIEAES